MRILALVAAAALACATPAIAGSYDGRWIAEIPPQDVPCNGASVMRVTVLDDTLLGDVHTPWGSNSFRGKLEADGSGNFTFGGDGGTILFHGATFDANWSNQRCGARHALGEREASDGKKAEMVADRRQRQAAFAALVTDANSGRSVDYTALRAAYPYSENWDPYGTRAKALLSEANAAQKGGDCAGALDRLAVAVRQDFTMDSAHALIADCSSGDTAVRENAIADGLVRSLMTSGDGVSEKTAYVIVTLREEDDVLANRHIQIKTRQVNLRAGNGHYYDRVEGVSMKDTAKPVALYFDVTAFTAGRLSRDAMLTTVNGTIH